ncbi:hypothetical protein [Mucisphaera calidilacus]|uniref:Uncharacterized protein n=1 Tax=Mucisphaera calidilacus TaxID=2527982 RepID=A0A518BVM1_9BACT|nr:hypothetical protein [Mucisphaera calidilacus]QDU71033.1 hypothetical protein Pan265_08780 [Mucisphaera calidilacus]
MPITCTENADSRVVTENQSAELTYTLVGSDDPLAAMTLLKTTAPESYQGLPRQNPTLEPVYIDQTNPDRCIWLGTVTYAVNSAGGASSPSTGSSSFSFDTGGGTQHITQSLGTTASYAASGTAPNFRGAIGVTHDSVEGVDILVPVYNFSETHYLPDTQVTSSYKGVLFNLTGKVNSGSFRGLAAGECLLLGASGTQRSDGASWEITFKFAGSPNRTGMSVGAMTGISKKGWEYLWVRYGDVEDAYSSTLVKQPVAAYVEKVYEQGDFAQLGIGTT